MTEITLLEENQVIGENASKIFKNLGVRSTITDYALMLGGIAEGKFNRYSPTLTNKTSPWFTKTLHQEQFVGVVRENGYYDRGFPTSRMNGIRPCTSYSSIKSACKYLTKILDIPIVKYGWYPQTIVKDKLLINQLENEWKNQTIHATGTYTTDANYLHQSNQSFIPRTNIEYEYPHGSGNRYIRILGDSVSNNKKLSDGTIVETNIPYWIKVEPIEWYIDEELDLAISRKVICAGIQLDNKETYDGNFDKTNMKKFLDNYFSKDIIEKEQFISTPICVNKLDMTFLTKAQIIGDNQLEVFKKYGVQANKTDFSILLGMEERIDNSSKKESFTPTLGTYWTKTDETPAMTAIIDEFGKCFMTGNGNRCNGSRPVIPYTSIKPIVENQKRVKEETFKVTYGEYPQEIVSESFSRFLEDEYQKGTLKKSGKEYTTDSHRITNYDDTFRERIFEEYTFANKKHKYIRFVGDENCRGKLLSDGRRVKEKEAYWISVKPITWLVDEKANIAITEKIIFSGVQFKNNGKYLGDFKNTDIKKFMDNYFSKEITEERKILQNKKTTKTYNPYEFEFEKVCEEDIIRGAIESNIAVFLHGKSSDGKSARVKQIDPDCTIVYLRNSTPDSLNGKSVYNECNGEMIDVPPTWYKKIKEKCEREPDKLHILFFDELTNAMPSIQGMAFNIILDKEVNGVWKLPDNCRIVAAGNDLDDSLAANEMAEPLFNRFAHVYIETTIEKWLKWAAKKENHIHPAIYAYITYKYFSKNEVLRTTFDGKQPNADPRKWEMASKVLYTTGKPRLLTGLIGDTLTTDFCNFCSQEVITIDKVKNNEGLDELVKIMKDSEKFATALNLSKCSEKELKVVRDFISKLGARPLSMFDILWSKGEEKRLEIIAKLRLNSNNRR